MDNDLDEHEDGSTKSGSDGRSHSEASKDSTETLSIVPSPLDFAGTADVRFGRTEVGMRTTYPTVAIPTPATAEMRV